MDPRAAQAEFVGKGRCRPSAGSLALAFGLMAGLVAGSARGFEVRLLAPAGASFSGPECLSPGSPEAALAWSTPTQPAVGETEHLFVAPAADCARSLLELRPATPRTVASGVYPLPGERPITARRLFDALESAPPDCGGAGGVDASVAICVVVSKQDGTTTTSAATLRLDSEAPDAPTGLTAMALDGAVQVSWELPTDTELRRWRVTVTDSAGGAREVDVEASGDPSVRIDGLANDVEHRVEVVGFDLSGGDGNASAPSGPLVFTPRASEGFWGRYERLGGGERGGCASAEGSTLVFAVALASLLRRRCRAWLVLLSLPAAARAEDPFASRDHAFRPGIALHATMFRPAIDRESGLSGTPYADLFGDSRPLLWRLEAGLENDAWLGVVSVRAGAGWWRVDGASRLGATDTPAGDPTALRLVPLSLSAQWSLDAVRDAWRAPIVPFLRAGFAGTAWSAERGEQVERSGWAFGGELGGGVELVLDALDPAAAASAGRLYGLHRTVLVLEWHQVWARGRGGLVLDGGGVGASLGVTL